MVDFDPEGNLEHRRALSVSRLVGGRVLPDLEGDEAERASKLCHMVQGRTGLDTLVCLAAALQVVQEHDAKQSST